MTSGTSPKATPKPRLALLLVLAALTLIPRMALGGNWDLAKLAEELSAAGPGTYRFLEERHLQVLTEPVRLEGRLSYEAGGRLIREVTRPRRERAVIEGNLLSIEANKVDPPVRILLSGQPVLSALVVALRATLQGDLALLQETYESELSGGSAAWSLRLEPKDADLRATVSALHLRGVESRIASIEVLETSGDRTVITLFGDP